MSKQLASAVHLTDESGIVHSFLPGETPPKWARKLITNPKAWGAGEDDEQDDFAAQTSAVLADAGVADKDLEDGVDAAVALASGQPEDDAAAPTPQVAVPKKNGSTAAWREYADANGFETDDDATRSDIIAALTAGGIPVE